MLRICFEPLVPCSRAWKELLSIAPRNTLPSPSSSTIDRKRRPTQVTWECQYRRIQQLRSRHASISSLSLQNPLCCSKNPSNTQRSLLTCRKTKIAGSICSELEGRGLIDRRLQCRKWLLVLCRSPCGVLRVDSAHAAPRAGLNTTIPTPTLEDALHVST